MKKFIQSVWTKNNHLVCSFSPYPCLYPPLYSFSLFPLCSLFGEKCQINRNVTSRMRGLLLYLLIEVPSCLSVWQLLLTSDVFFESESAFFGSECYRQQRSGRVKLNVGLFAELLLPPDITKLVIHLIVNPALSFRWVLSAHEFLFCFPRKVANMPSRRTAWVVQAVFKDAQSGMSMVMKLHSAMWSE